MSGDVQVRFCERPGVRFPRATHPVILFAREGDARRVLEVLAERLGAYGLKLHPTKTRLVEFRRPDRLPTPHGGGRSRPETFDLLGFTHRWGKSRLGKPIVKRQTARDRFGRALSRIAEWCKRHRHAAIRDQHATLVAKLRGHFQYFGIWGNSKALARLRYEVIRIWRKWLSRRSRRKPMTWERMKRLLERYPLPLPRIAHPLPLRAANP
jgi:hypothetical protein